MCGRYRLSSTEEEIAEFFDAEPMEELHPRYNIAPSQPVPVIRQAGSGRAISMVRWGLVPFWAQDPSIGSRPRATSAAWPLWCATSAISLTVRSRAASAISALPGSAPRNGSGPPPRLDRIVAALERPGHLDDSDLLNCEPGPRRTFEAAGMPSIGWPWEPRQNETTLRHHCSHQYRASRGP